MTIQKFESKEPSVSSSAFIHASAIVIGNVTIDADSSIWPGTVIRGDVNSITIGKRTSIQDNSVIHVTHDGPYHPGGFSTIISDDVTVGHQVVLHGCRVNALCIIGMRSCLMDGAIVESNVIIGAGSLVPPGKRLESGFLWLGSPVKKIRPLTEKEIEEIQYSATQYVKLKDKYIPKALT